MARTSIAAQVASASALWYANPPTGLTLTQTAADAVNFNSTPATGKEVLVVQNSGAAPYTVTVHSVADQLGRTGDITTFSIAAGAIAWLGPFPVTGWKQSDGTLWFDGSNVALKFSVIQVNP